jgi:aldehyde dehydrogenase (NAD+)
VKNREKPLALYLFTSNKATEEKFLREVSYGGGCINDTIIHLATSGMGFGGVGNSGMGSYHGKKSFETFSHEKSIVKKYTWLDLPMRYQPYTNLKEKLVRMFVR